MLLANMAKDDSLQRVLELKRSVPKGLSTSQWAMDQLLDCFVKGAEGGYNKEADYDYLSYFFADLAKVRDPCQTSNQNYSLCTTSFQKAVTTSRVPKFTTPTLSRLPNCKSSLRIPRISVVLV